MNPTSALSWLGQEFNFWPWEIRFQPLPLSRAVLTTVRWPRSETVNCLLARHSDPTPSRGLVFAPQSWF